MQLERLAWRTTGWKDRGPRLTALGMQDDAIRRIRRRSVLSCGNRKATFACSRAWTPPLRYARLRLFTGTAAASSLRMTITGLSRKNSPANAKPTQFGQRWPNWASPSSPRNLPKPKAASNVCTWGILQDRLRSELRLAHACDSDSANAVLSFIADYNRRFARTPRAAAKAWQPLPAISSASAPSATNASQQRQCRAVDVHRFQMIRLRTAASVLRVQKFSSIRL